ncbi:MAG: DUF3263 domain-containing protein [Acidimicrobiia bacterium]
MDSVLAPRDRAILDLERTWWQQPGSKEAAIKAELGMSGTRYYELLAEIIERPDALHYDPLTVRRVRRARTARRRARFMGHPAYRSR